jgi:deoxyribodipyrimidine photolyase
VLSLLNILSGLFKAFPKLADIFEDAVKFYRNAQAESHRREKDSAVDAFINQHSVSCDSVQWSGEVDEASTSSGGGESSTTFHSGSTQGDKSS